jgi:hypothetical protein
LVHGADTRVQSTKKELREKKRFVGTTYGTSKNVRGRFLEDSLGEEETDLVVWKVRKIITRPEGSARPQL